MISVHRDYIMRIIEQMGQVLAVIVSLRGRGYADEAIAKVVREAGDLLGVDFEALRSMSGDEAIQTLLEDRLTRLDASDVEWWISLTVLLEEVADLHRRKGDGENARHFEHISDLALGQIPPDGASAGTLEQLVSSAATDTQIPASLRTVLWLYHERVGAYAQAEDWLFDLLETEPLTDSLLFRAAAFYQRLEALPDDELTRGGLPRTEVREGREYLWTLATLRDGESEPEGIAGGT